MLRRIITFLILNVFIIGVTYLAVGVGAPVILHGNVTFSIPGFPKIYLKMYKGKVAC